MTNGSEYLRARDIVGITGVSLRTARRWIENKILASVKVGGARLVARGELERLLSPSHMVVDDESTTQKNINKIMSLLIIGKASWENTSHLLPDSFPERHLLTCPDTFPAEGLNERE